MQLIQFVIIKGKFQYNKKKTIYIGYTKSDTEPAQANSHSYTHRWAAGLNTLLQTCLYFAIIISRQYSFTVCFSLLIDPSQMYRQHPIQKLCMHFLFLLSNFKDQLSYKPESLPCLSLLPHILSDRNSNSSIRNNMGGCWLTQYDITQIDNVKIPS
jgi:hypothetical protein